MDPSLDSACTDPAAITWQRPGRLAPVVLMVAAAIVLSAPLGCAKSGGTQAPSSTAPPAAPAPESGTPQAPAAAAPSVAVAQFPALEPSEKRALIAQSFPVEVPVPAGSVIRGQAQGDSAWDYELTCALRARELAQWYRMAYEGRSWQLIDERSGRTETGRDFVELELGKGYSQSRLTIVDEGAQSRVVAVIGLGEAVLESQ